MESPIANNNHNKNASKSSQTAMGNRWFRGFALLLVASFLLFLWDKVELRVTGTQQEELMGVQLVFKGSSPSSTIQTKTSNSTLANTEVDSRTHTGTTADQDKDKLPATEASNPQDATSTSNGNVNANDNTKSGEPAKEKRATSPLTRPPEPPEAVDDSLTPQECENQCQTSQNNDFDLSKASNMRQRFTEYRQRYVAQLQQDYGEKLYKDLFTPIIDPETNTPVSIGRDFIFTEPPKLKLKRGTARGTPPPPGTAWKRFVRKLSIKVLQIQLGSVLQQSKASYDCSKRCHYKYHPGTYTNYVWATGGHSSSAGHGNFYREAYTAVMERAVQPIFRAIGLDFEARGYSSGGTSSADEYSLCSQAFYGRDIDSLSWDFGMTDGKNKWKIGMYAYRAAQVAKARNTISQPGGIPRRPALFGIHQGDEHNAVLHYMYELGMPVLGYNGGYEANLFAAFPDMMGMSDQEIEAVPRLARHFKCAGGVETGEPGCNANKFNRTFCPSRAGRAKWHQGWKFHALAGHLIATMLLDALQDAIEEVAKLEPIDNEDMPAKEARITSHLQRLSQEEAADYNNILNAPVHEYLRPEFERIWAPGSYFAKMTPGMAYEPLLKDPILCHTALLPADIRFRGILTESNMVGNIYNQYYDKGYSYQKIQKTEAPPPRGQRKPVMFVDERPGQADKLTLVMNEDEREKCEEPTFFDLDDWYHTTSMQPWKTLLLPNDSEMRYYEFNPLQSRGWILMCLKKCSWGKCDGTDMHDYLPGNWPGGKKGQAPPTKEERADYGTVELEVNNVPVTNAVRLEKCYFLTHEDPDPTKTYVWKPNDAGKYEIRVRIANAKRYSVLKMTSFVFL